MNATAQRQWKPWALHQAEYTAATPPQCVDDDTLSQIMHQEPGDAAEGLGALCDHLAGLTDEDLSERAALIRATLANAACLFSSFADTTAVTS